jgi:hypothetical protein
VDCLNAFDPAEFAALHAEDKRVWQVTREHYQRMKKTTKDNIEERIASMLAKGCVFEPYSAKQLHDHTTALLQQV